MKNSYTLGTKLHLRVAWQPNVRCFGGCAATHVEGTVKAPYPIKVSDIEQVQNEKKSFTFR
jgi:hypothetical protein